MDKLLTLTDGSDVLFRSVGTDRDSETAQADYAYCYDIAKRTVMDDVVALAGEWPEAQQHEFFSSDFFEDVVYILFAHDQRIGCASIHEDANAVFLQKVYIEPDYQEMGIWTQCLDLGLDIAHECKKPLKMAVLKSNTDMVETSEKYGFFETESFIMHEEAAWVRMHIMTHRDTLQYMPQPDIFVAPEN